MPKTIRAKANLPKCVASVYQTNFFSHQKVKSIFCDTKLIEKGTSATKYENKCTKKKTSLLVSKLCTFPASSTN